MAGEQELFQNYTLVGGEETYKNPLNQSHLAMRRLENLVPSVRGDLIQKGTNFSFGVATLNWALMPYIRTNSDGTISRFLLGAGSNKKVHYVSGTGTTETELLPGTAGLAPLAQPPSFVQANNLLYFTDSERWFVWNGTALKTAGMPHPVDPPTFTTAAGTLNVATNRYYWVAWADLTSAEFEIWGNRSPRSAATGALTNQKVTVTRPAGPPPRATHWILFASETDDDATFGAWLATIPIATTTFEDQSPFLDQAGTAMLAIRSPIRNNIPIPGRWAKLHKGRIFVGGFNRLPVVVRNPDFEDNAGATLAGWENVAPAWAPTTASTTQHYDRTASMQVSTTTGSGAGTVSALVVRQDITRIVRPGRTYEFWVARRLNSFTGTPKLGMQVRHEENGVFQSATSVTTDLLTATSPVGTWTDGLAITWTVPKRDLQTSKTKFYLDFYATHDADTDRITGHFDFIRVWEQSTPLQVAFSALEEVEGLQNGRGEESMPGSTPPPFDDDASDVSNLLFYPQTASELRGAESFNDSLVVFSDLNGVPIFGDTFDDFHFSEQVSLATGLATANAITKSRHGLFFLSSDLKVFQAPLNEPVEELSLPIRDKLASEISLVDPTTFPPYLTVFDFGDRAWLVVSYGTPSSGANASRQRIFDLETRQWFRLTGEDSNGRTPVTVYDAALGKRALVLGGTGVAVLDDPRSAYSTAGGNGPVGTLRQVLLDLGDPGSFKVWKDVLVHTNAPVADVTVTFWIDPFDPDSPGTGTVLTSTSVPAIAATETLAELLRGFFGSTADAHGKRLLLQVDLAATSTPKRILGLEVAAERTVRHAR